MNIGLLMLEDALLAQVVDFPINLTHESDWDIWHEVEDVNSGPGSSTV